MTYRLVFDPAIEPISRTEAKLHLRVDGTEDDALIDALIVAARNRAEHETRRALITQTWELLLDEFPADEIELDKSPVQSVSGISYYDVAGVLQTVSAADYSVDIYTLPAWIVLSATKEWPSTYDMAHAVIIQFVCGYGLAASSVPTPIRQWMLLQIGTMYAHRETLQVGGVVTPLDFADCLLDPYRVTKVG